MGVINKGGSYRGGISAGTMILKLNLPIAPTEIQAKCSIDTEGKIATSENISL